MKTILVLTDFSLRGKVFFKSLVGKQACWDGILTIDLKKNDRFLIGKKHIKVD